MSDSDAVTLSLPRKYIKHLPTLSARLTDRMHKLLERNTDGKLGPTEREELETLVEMTQFAQIVALASRRRTRGM